MDRTAEHILAHLHRIERRVDQLTELALAIATRLAGPVGGSVPVKDVEALAAAIHTSTTARQELQAAMDAAPLSPLDKGSTP